MKSETQFIAAVLGSAREDIGLRTPPDPAHTHTYAVERSIEQLVNAPLNLFVSANGIGSTSRVISSVGGMGYAKEQR
ncbi:hypothetical protein KAX17_11345 [Candidatus Bipolaricaulota bacterium]|nr:hypothetical protein [Candidatus Bipolaricaulota bacterium]